MEHSIVVVLLALVLVAATNLLGRRIPVPTPVIQTLVGIAVAFVPGVPTVALHPDFVLLAILPPLVYAAAVVLPWNDFLRNIRPIGALAFGLVFATVAAVALVARSYGPELPFAAALALGAVVAPTDPVAATALGSRFPVPRRIAAILEGEGLINDAVGLTIKTIAVGALLGRPISMSSGILRFALIVAGETAYGWALGWVVAAIRRRIDDANIETLVTVVTPFAAYLPAALLGGSGVLATVATGMYIGERTPELVPSGIRLQLTSVWTVIVYSLNGVLFLLSGLQARSIWNGTAGPAERIVPYACLIALVVIVVRIVWVFAVEALRRLLLPRVQRTTPRHSAFVAWSGMRGAISLAAALSIPASMPARPVIIFVTAWVIGATLLVQGTTLPWLVRLLRLDRDAGIEKEEEQRVEAKARVQVARAAIAALKDDRSAIGTRLRQEYELTIKRSELEDSAGELKAEAHIRRKAIESQRRCVIQMHRNGDISEEVLHRIERELDLEETALANRVADLE